MTLSLTEIDAVVAELATALAGATLVGADPLPGPAILIRFDAGGETRRVLVSAQPHASRLNLATRRFDLAEGERATQQDRDFADRLRRELRGSKVASIKRVLGDRVVMFEFDDGDRKRVLMFECSGQHPNLFLCDDRRVILMMLAMTKSQRRDLRPGSRYEKPLKHQHDTVETLRFVGQGASVSQRIEEFYEGEEARSERAKAAGGIRAALKTALQRQERLIEAITGDLAKAREVAASDAKADAAVPVAASEAEVADEAAVAEAPVAPVEGEGAAVVPEVPEAPAKPVARGSVVWQERRLIQARAAAEHLGTLITGMLDGDPKGLEAARRHVEEVMAPLAERLGNRATAGGVEARDDRAGARGGEGRPMRATVGTPMPLPAGVRRFRSQDGTPIWVASNPMTAPQLTFRAAQDDDFWLRVDGASGAHVIVACGSHEPAFATLIDAGLLAVHFSRADATREQPVQVARRREVAPAGREAPPDEVRVKRSRLFAIRPDARRVAALLGSEGRGAPVPDGPGRASPGRPGASSRPSGDRPFATGPHGPRPAFGAPRAPDRPRRDGPPPARDDRPRRDGPARPPVDRGPRPGTFAPRPPRAPREDRPAAPARREPGRPVAPARRRYPAGTRGPARK